MVKLFYRLVRCAQMAENQKHDSVLKAFAAAYARIPPVALTDRLAAGARTTFSVGSYAKSDVSSGDLAIFTVQQLENARRERETTTFSGGPLTVCRKGRTPRRILIKSQASAP